jgi:hypothetical protein
MTPATDDDALEAAFEAFLGGRSTTTGADGLTAFADGVRATAARPPRPSAALAALLETGLLTDQSSVPAAPAATPSRRRRARMFATTAFAKFLSAGLLAKAAAATGVVAVGVVTAGSVDGLPTPAQHAFATVVSHVTPFHAPDDVQEADDGGTTSTTTTGTTTTGTTAGTAGDTTGTAGSGGTTDASGTGTSTTGSSTTTTSGTTSGDDANRPANFGSQVSERAQSPDKGKNFGQQVSKAAHDNHSFGSDNASTGTGEGTSGSDTSGSDTSGGSEDTSKTTTTTGTSSTATADASSGKGSSHGHR